MAEKKKRGPKAVSAAHKQAMATGRTESRAVRLYLEALAAHKPKRGRKRTADSITRRLEAVEQQLAEADPLTALGLVQEQMDLTDELASMEAGDNIPELEEGFVAVAAAYGERKGISYKAWRAIGVEPSVLSRAGISR